MPCTGSRSPAAGYVDQGVAELLSRHQVIRLLKGAGLLEEDRVRLLLSWRHTGFSLHNQVSVPPGDGRAIEALARYCLRTSVSLTRLCLTADSDTVHYLAGDGQDDAPGETLDAPPWSCSPASWPTSPLPRGVTVSNPS